MGYNVWVGLCRMSRLNCRLGRPCCCSSGSDQPVDSGLGAPVLCCHLSGPGDLSCRCCPSGHHTEACVWPYVPKRKRAPHPKTKRTVPGPCWSDYVLSRPWQSSHCLQGEWGSSHCPTPLIFSVTERSYFWAGRVKVRAGQGEEGGQLQRPALKSPRAGTHMEISKAPLSNLTLKEDPELCFHGGKIFPEEGFIIPWKASVTGLGPSLLSIQPHLLTPG